MKRLDYTPNLIRKTEDLRLAILERVLNYCRYDWIACGRLLRRDPLRSKTVAQTQRTQPYRAFVFSALCHSSKLDGSPRNDKTPASRRLYQSMCRPRCPIFVPPIHGFEKNKHHLKLIFNDLQLNYLKCYHNGNIFCTFVYEGRCSKDFKKSVGSISGG